MAEAAIIRCGGLNDSSRAELVGMFPSAAEMIRTVLLGLGSKAAGAIGKLFNSLDREDGDILRYSIHDIANRAYSLLCNKSTSKLEHPDLPNAHYVDEGGDGVIALYQVAARFLPEEHTKLKDQILTSNPDINDRSKLIYGYFQELYDRKKWDENDPMGNGYKLLCKIIQDSENPMSDIAIMGSLATAIIEEAKEIDRESTRGFINALRLSGFTDMIDSLTYFLPISESLETAIFIFDRIDVNKREAYDAIAKMMGISRILSSKTLNEVVKGKLNGISLTMQAIFSGFRDNTGNLVRFIDHKKRVKRIDAVNMKMKGTSLRGEKGRAAVSPQEAMAKFDALYPNNKSYNVGDNSPEWQRYVDDNIMDVIGIMYRIETRDFNKLKAKDMVNFLIANDIRVLYVNEEYSERTTSILKPNFWNIKVYINGVIAELRFISEENSATEGASHYLYKIGVETIDQLLKPLIPLSMLINLGLNPKFASTVITEINKRADICAEWMNTWMELVVRRIDAMKSARNIVQALRPEKAMSALDALNNLLNIYTLRLPEAQSQTSEPLLQEA